MDMTIIAPVFSMVQISSIMMLYVADLEDIALINYGFQFAQFKNKYRFSEVQTSLFVLCALEYESRYCHLQRQNKGPHKEKCRKLTASNPRYLSREYENITACSYRNRLS